MYGFRVWTLFTDGHGLIHRNVTKMHKMHGVRGEEVCLTSSYHDKEVCYVADTVKHFYMQPEAEVREMFQAGVEQGD